MKCTGCGELIKPVVAIDIDGTLGDYHTHFLEFAEAYLDQRNDRFFGYGGEGGFKEWFCEAYRVDHRTWHDIKLAYRQGGMKRSMPPHAYAALPTATARAAGAEVWLTTTRPYLRLDGIDPDTRFWLARHGIEYDGLLYDEDKYRVLAERVDPERVVMVLDDLPEQYDAAESAFPGAAVLRRNRYNEAVSRPCEVIELRQAADIIKRRVHTWRATHENHRDRS